MAALCFTGEHSPLFELARVLVRFNHIANVEREPMRCAASRRSERSSKERPGSQSQASGVSRDHP
jgi:hypothetical protein